LKIMPPYLQPCLPPRRTDKYEPESPTRNHDPVCKDFKPGDLHKNNDVPLGLDEMSQLPRVPSGHSEASQPLDAKAEPFPLRVGDLDPAEDHLSQDLVKGFAQVYEQNGQLLLGSLGPILRQPQCMGNKVAAPLRYRPTLSTWYKSHVPLLHVFLNHL